MTLALIVGAAAYSRTNVGPLQETIAAVMQLTDNQSAVLQGPALAIPLVIAAIPLGLAIDRYSRVRLLVIFSSLNVIGGILTALSPNFSLLVAARSLVGLTGLAITPVAISLLADLFVPAYRGRAAMVVGFGQVAGTAVAFALGGALIVSSDAPDSWRWSMLWLTAPLALVVLCALSLREPERGEVVVVRPSISDLANELWRLRKAVGPLLVGIVSAEIALGGALIWIAPLLSRRFALAPDQIGFTVAIGLVISGILGPLLGGTLADFCERSGGSRKTMGALSVVGLLSIPVGLFGIMPGIASTAVLFLLFTTLICAVAVMGTTLFTIVVPNELRGLCIMVLVAVTVLFSSGVGPPAVSLVAAIAGGPAMIGTATAAVCVAGSFLAATAFWVGRRFVQVDTIP